MKKSMFLSLTAAMLAVPSFAADNVFKQAELKPVPYPQHASMMLDGKPDTAWRSYVGENASGTIAATFPEPTEIQAVTLFGNNLVSGVLEVSTDGTTWEEAGPFNTANAPLFLGFRFAEPREVRALRIKLTGGAKKEAIVVREVRAFIPDTAENFATFRAIRETGDNTNWRFPAVWLVDGDNATCTAHYSKYNGSVLELDLGKMESVSSVSFVTRGTYASVAVDTSTDGKSWTRAGELADVNSGTEVKFNPVPARFLKIGVTGKYSVAPSEIIVH